MFAYFKMGQVIALNVKISCFYWDHLAEINAFRMLSICFTLVMVTSVSSKTDNFGSIVIPIIFGYLAVNCLTR